MGSSSLIGRLIQSMGWAISSRDHDQNVDVAVIGGLATDLGTEDVDLLRREGSNEASDNESQFTGIILWQVRNRLPYPLS